MVIDLTCSCCSSLIEVVGEGVDGDDEVGRLRFALVFH